MNYHVYYPIDVVNGPGTRCTLFVSGCEHRCQGCYNPITWNPKNGQPYDIELENKILDDLGNVDIPRRGLSLSGGDPLLPSNIPAILRLVKRVKSELPEKDIWCWTGYHYSSLSSEQLSVLKYVDVLIDGKFIKSEADPSLTWRGSLNQRIIPLQPQVCAIG